jgi:hypothetical protein
MAEIIQRRQSELESGAGVRATQRVQLVSGLGLCLLGATFVCLLLAGRMSLSAPSARHRSPLLVRRGPIEELLRKAAEHRTRAKIAVNQERAALEVWDPGATADVNPEAWRLQLLSADPDGDLERARRASYQAAALARTRSEAYRCAELLVLIEHELGHHQVEFEHAQTLVRLRPQALSAQRVWRRAARCLGDPSAALGGRYAPPEALVGGE